MFAGISGASRVRTRNFWRPDAIWRRLWRAAPRSCHDRTESVWRPGLYLLGTGCGPPHVKDGRAPKGNCSMIANDNGKSGGKPKTPKPRVKKSETLEVRIPHETKQAFLNACREDGTTASEVVRDQVQSYLDAREHPPQEKDARHAILSHCSPLWTARGRWQPCRAGPHRTGRFCLRRRRQTSRRSSPASTPMVMACCRSMSSSGRRSRGRWQ